MKLRDRLQWRPKERLARVEKARVLVYTPTDTWWARLPEAGVVKNLGRAGLHYSEVKSWRLAYSLFFGGGSFLIIVTLGVQLLPLMLVLPMVPIATVGLSVLGYRIGHRMEVERGRSERIWCVRSEWDETKKRRTIEPMEYESLRVLMERSALEELLGGQIPHEVEESMSIRPVEVNGAAEKEAVGEGTSRRKRTKAE